MNIYELVANKNTAETVQLTKHRLERARVRRIAAECERLIDLNSHVPATVADLNRRLEAANKRISELDAALAAPRWVQPLQRTIQKIAAIQTCVTSAQVAIAMAETEITIAVRDEKPKAEGEARKKLGAAESELVKARKWLSESLAAIGLDPKAL